MGRRFESTVRRLIPVATTVIGGVLGGPAGAGVGLGLGTSLSGDKKDTPSVDTEVSNVSTNITKPTTPEGSVTGKGQADLTDTGLGDVVSVFDMFKGQEDEMDKLLKRKFY